MKSSIFSLAISAVAIIAPHLVLCEPKAKIGVVMPFSGEVAAITEKTRKGFALAEEKYRGEVEVVYEDIGGLGAAKAVSAASKLLEIDQVSVIVGPFGPEQTLPIAPIAAKHDVVLLSFSLCSSDFKAIANVFCGYPATPAQLASMFPVLESKIKSKARNLAIVAQESQFGNETGALLQEAAKERGVAIVLDERTAAGDTDFRAVVAKVRRAAPQAVFLAYADPAHAFALIKQLWEGGYHGERFAYIDYDDKYLAQFGAAAEGVYVPGAFTGSYSPAFISAYKARFAGEPDIYAAEAFDLLETAVNALQATGWKRSGVASAIPRLSFNHSAIPGFHFLADRTVAFPMGVLLAKAGRFVPVQ